MDPAALEAELRAIKQQRSQTRAKLDELRGGRGRGRGGTWGGRGAGPFGRGGDRSSNGPPARDGPGSGSERRTSVFDRLQSRDGDRREQPDAEAGGSERRAVHPAELLLRSASGGARPPAAGGRLSSRVVVPPGGGASGSGRDREPERGRDWQRERPRGGGGHSRSPGRERGRDWDRDRERERDRDWRPSDRRDAQHGSASDPAAAAPGSRKRLLSAVMINGEARTLSLGQQQQQEQQQPGADVGRSDSAPALGAAERPVAKRPALQTDDGSRKRARRMFGALLVGTLQKAQDEDAAFRSSETAVRRQELERHASERMEAEVERVREAAAAARREEREAQINALHDLNLQADIKALELRYAKRIAQRQKLAPFCVTAAQPPLYWLPAKPSDESDALLQAAGGAFEAWQQQQLAQLELDRETLRQRAQERREAALARAAARQAAGGGQERDDGGSGAGEDAAAHGDNRSEGERSAESEHGSEDGSQRSDDGQDEQQEEQQEQDQDMAGSEEGDEEEQPQAAARAARHAGSEEEERLLVTEDEED